MTYGAIQSARGRPQPRPVSDAEWAEPLAPRQEVAYRCRAGHRFAVVFAAGIAAPASWDCRCGARAVLADPGPTAAAGRVAAEESHEARCHRFVHERRTLAQLEELLAERLAVLASARASVGWLTMTREEWLEVLATAPATRSQVGAIHAEFARLGFTAAERAERLAATAGLLGLEGLWSTRDLVMGDAGRLVGMLRQLADRPALDAAIATPSPEPAERGMTLAEALAEVVRLLAGSWTLPPVPAGETGKTMRAAN